MANNYNGSRRIPVVLVRDGSSRLVVRRETWADLLARDVRQHTWPDGVELVKLDLETMAALVDGDLGRARSITGSAAS